MPPVGRPVHADALPVALMADVAAKAASVLVTIANATAARSVTILRLRLLCRQGSVDHN